MSAGTQGTCHTMFNDRAKWTVPEVAVKRVAASENDVFVVDAEGRQETYGEFWRHSERLAAHLGILGVRPGDRLAILSTSGIPALHAWLAAGLAGAIDVSVNGAYRGEPLRHVLAIADPCVIIVETGLIAALHEILPTLPSLRHIVVVGPQQPEANPDGKSALEWHDYDDIIARQTTKAVLPAVRPSDIATVIFTSGTTGPSKGVLMPHAQVCLLALQTIEATRMSDDDTFYCIHPLFHIAGKFMGVFAIFACGGRLVLEKKFTADSWLARVRETQSTISIAHGPMIEMIDAEPPRGDRDHSLTRLMCCPLPKTIGHSFPKRFGIETIEMWGMTEVGCPCWTSLQKDYLPGSCGKVLTDWYDLEIVDPETDEPLPPGSVGEIVVRPKFPWTIMQGYMGMPDATAEAWRNLMFHTGDSAYQDADGNVFFIDRLGDRIRRRAENISSFDIEAAAIRHPAVRECAAVGVASQFESDDDVFIFVTPYEGCEIVPLELLKFLFGQLPHFMVPRYIEVLDALPRTPTNKVKKKELRLRGISSQTWDRKAQGVSLKALAERAS